MGRIRKKTSKRQTLSHKYKVDRKIREHHRKTRREERKAGGPKLKKDPGIPNLWPFKEEMLAKMEAHKAKIAEHQEQQKERRAREANKARVAGTRPAATDLTTLAADAASRGESFVRGGEGATGSGSDFYVNDGSRKAYFREFKKVVEAADVILEVLDARDPLGCRCTAIEQRILANPAKKIVLVLNKIDLVPKKNVVEWLRYLRNEFPTVAFKCSTQTQRTRLGQRSTGVQQASDSLLQSTECLGADALVSLLKNYTRNLDIKTAITVGIIGYPNVGKSSLINSLKRAKVVSVGAQPGITKTAQEVHLDRNIKLLDCPGIVFAARDSTDPGVVLRNAVRIDQLEDPVAPVELIMRRCRKDQLQTKYAIPAFNSAQEFLALIARQKGRLRKGGVPDYAAAATLVLQDWNTGRISFYTVPPEQPHVHVGAEVVPTWGKDFDLTALARDDASLFAELPEPIVPDGLFMQLESAGPGARPDTIYLVEEDAAAGGSSSSTAMSTSSTATTSSSSSAGMQVDRRKPTTRATTAAAAAGDDEDAINPQLNRSRKQQAKKDKKQRRKTGAAVPELGGDDAADDAGGDAFDFTTDFVADNDGGDDGEWEQVDDEEFGDAE